MKSRRVVYLALFTVISILLTRFASIRIAIFGVEGVRIGIGSLGIYMAAVFFGPVDGAIVGAVADLIGFWLNPMGPYMPHFTITSALRGLIAGLVFFYIFKRRWSFGKGLVVIGIPKVVVGLFLVPYFIHQLFGAPFMVLFIPRIVALPITLIMTVSILEVLNRYVPFTVMEGRTEA